MPKNIPEKNFSKTTLFGKNPNPAEKEKMVQAMFSSIAGRYDLNNSLLSFGQHYRWKRQAVRQVNFKPEMKALDLCAGTADLAMLLARQNTSTPQDQETGQIYAVDLNAQMLEQGHQKIIQEKLASRITCLRGHAEQLQFKNKTFDLAMVAFGIRNVNHIPKAFEEICRVLKPGGRLICLEFSRPTSVFLRQLYHFYSFQLLPWVGTVVSGDKTGVYRYLPTSIRHFPDQETLRELMLGSGFQKVEYINLSGGIVAIHIGWR